MQGSDEQTREQLLIELDTLRERVAELEASKHQRDQSEETLQESQKAALCLAEENTLLARIGRIISSTLEIEEVYEQFATEVRQLVDLDRTSINTVDPEAGNFTFKYLLGQAVPGRYIGAVLPIRGSQTEQMMATGQAVIRGHMVAHQEFEADSTFLEVGLRSSIMVPLSHKGRIIGALSLSSRREGAYGLRDQTILEHLAGQIAPAIENSELYAQVKSSEEALRDSEELFRSLMEHAADAFIIHDLEGQLLDVNQMACDGLGYTREDMLALYPWDFVATMPPGGAKEWKEMVPGIPLMDTSIWRRKDGTTFPVEVRLRTFELRGQRIIFALGRDITQRQQAEQALRELVVLEERNRLARELHDSVTQVLYSANLMAEAGRRFAGAGDLERAKHYLSRLGDTCQQALKEMRLLVYQLRPLALESEGIVGALRQRLDAVEKRAGMEARLLFDGPIDLPARLEEELYRVAQEALNNALKHAAATSVTVRFASGDGCFTLEVEDNGKGFDPDTVANAGGMGLVSMRERVENLGGALSILSAPGEGTKIKIRVPE